MGKFLILTVLLSAQAFANPPECPLYKNKHECLAAAEKNFNDSLEFIDESYEDDGEKNQLIQASLDIKTYESMACQKTCLR